MRIIALLLFMIPVIACTQTSSTGAGQTVVFTAVNVIPMDKEVVLKNQHVIVKDGRIVSVGDAAKTTIPKGAIVVDGKGKFLIPGLAEMHGHVPPVDNLEPMKETLKLFAYHGITTVRGMLGHPLHIELRRQLQSGELPGPRFYTSGPSFNGNSVPTPDRAAALVREQKKAGYDFLKLHPGLTPETFAAVAKTAHEVKIPFAGHVSYKVGVWAAIDSGYASIDHLDGFVESLVPGLDQIPEQEAGLFGVFIGDRADTTRIAKLVTALKNKNIWVVPTQALAERWMSPEVTSEQLLKSPEMKYVPQGLLTNWTNAKNSFSNNPKFDAASVNRFIQLRRKLIFECNRAGVGLLLGCDAPQVFNVPGLSTHQELEYLVKSGLSPFDALRTGTVNVGKYFDLETQLGVIRAGAFSDLILLGANPLEDIRNTQKIEGVMLGKQWMPKDYLSTELKKLEKS